jgi:LacI family transcriptional regulator
MSRANTPANTPPRGRRRVLLWVEASRAYGRGCLLGIAGFARSRTDWRIFYFEHRLGQDVPPFFADLRVDGVISRTDNQAAADHLAELRVPVVDLRGAVQTRFGRTLDTDHRGCAELAVDHFWNRGFRSMAFCGYPGVDWSVRRREAFVAAAKAKGIEAPFYMAKGSLSLQETFMREAIGERDDAALEQWLLDLPKPVAIFAANDVRGRQVVSACTNAGLAVPEQVAVLGVDNDEVICELSDPPLSSIEPDTYRLGYRGAELLESFMNDPSTIEPGPVELVWPRKVVARLSSDVAAIDDDLVSQCLRLIREQGGIVGTVAELADAVNVSRPTLERRFREAINRSPKQEIDRVRLDRARRLVRDTEYTLREIAELTGYSTASRLLLAYRRRYGITPGQDREQDSLR